MCFRRPFGWSTKTKGEFGGTKDPKTDKMPVKQGNPKRRNWPHHRDWPQTRQNTWRTKGRPPIYLDGPIRANRFADSRESLASRESFRGSRTEPLFCESRFGGPQIANLRFEAIRANRSHVVKIGFFFRIDLRESIQANRPDSRCESPGHLSRQRTNGTIFTGPPRPSNEQTESGQFGTISFKTVRTFGGNC